MKQDDGTPQLPFSLTDDDERIVILGSFILDVLESNREDALSKEILRRLAEHLDDGYERSLFELPPNPERTCKVLKFPLQET